MTMVTPLRRSEKGTEAAGFFPLIFGFLLTSEGAEDGEEGRFFDALKSGVGEGGVLKVAERWLKVICEGEEERYTAEQLNSLQNKSAAYLLTTGAGLELDCGVVGSVFQAFL